MEEEPNLRVGPTPPPKPGEGRSRRVQSIIKAYNSGVVTSGEEASEMSNPGFKYSGYTSSRDRSYRLTSLDRLAQRQKLFEANGLNIDESDNKSGSETRVVSHEVRLSTIEVKTNSVNGSKIGASSENLVNGGGDADDGVSSLQSKRELFFKAETPSPSNSGQTIATAPTPTGAITSLATNLQSRSATATPSVGLFANGSLSNPATSMPSATITSNSVGVTGISSLKESLQSNKENHVAPQAPAPAPPLKEITSSLGAKVEALKRELSEDNRERERLKERDKAPSAPLASIQNLQPPETKKFREVDYVGFATLPNQVYRRAVKKGFEFTLMVVGESGLGKSTLINSMFLTDIYSQEYPGPSLRTKKTVQVEQCKVVLKENAVNLTLTVVDTPGFGDSVDNSNWIYWEPVDKRGGVCANEKGLYPIVPSWQPIIDYIESKYEEYLNSESRVLRKQIPDNRVHCCLYFIAPSGHGLKPLDIECMKRLHDKVNIIPVIAKADTLTPDECCHLKKQILNEIAQNKIKIYDFPEMIDEEANKVQKPLRERVPFAVVGANHVFEVEGRKVRGRKYPWGIVEVEFLDRNEPSSKSLRVENMEHCDFIPLRDMLIRTNMSDLKEVTANIHYENYRSRKLGGVHTDGKPAKVSNKNPLAQMEEERREHESKIKKMESEMEQVFEMKVKEKTQKLKDTEVDMHRRHEQMKKGLEQQEVELMEKRAAFEAEVKEWENSNGVTLAELRRKSLESSSKEQVDGKENKKKKKGLF
ncbi:septin-7-like isoform X3 [Artemia franciscana]|uniref:septin-7-like isoform X3 n=1 Tax=Artemia franciscana TaxID=6661 RepID=UPI0032DB2FF5